MWFLTVELVADREEGGRTGEMSNSRPGNEAAEFTSVELMFTTVVRLRCWTARRFIGGCCWPSWLVASENDDDDNPDLRPKSSRSLARVPVGMLRPVVSGSGGGDSVVIVCNLWDTVLLLPPSDLELG